MDPDVSVIIPAYRRFRELTYAVESVLAQTVPVLEVIIIDDGSVDELPEMIPRIIKQRPAWRERVRYFRQENQGQSVARNNGISKAKGKWLAFNDSDDLWLPQKLEWQFRALERSGDCGLCFTDAWFMNSLQMKMTLFQLARTSYEVPIGTVEDLVRFIEHIFQAWVQTVVARADLVRKVMFDEHLRFQEDLDFIFRMAVITKCCYVNMPMVLIDRCPAEDRHWDNSREWHEEEFRLRMNQYRHEKNLGESEELDPKIKKIFKGRLRDVHSSWTNNHLVSGNYDKARESVSKAAAYQLTPGIALKWAATNIAPSIMQRALLARDRRKSHQKDLDPMK
jgi:glycosyltransferase involved in cell wall biosynthesis